MKLISTLTLMCVAFWLHAQITPSIQWQKSVGGSFIDETRSICKNYTDGFVLTGFTLSSDGDISSPKGGNGWVVWLDSNADIQHQLTIDADLQTISQTPDAGYIIAGSKMVYHAISSNSSYDFFLMKMDSAGNIIWQHTYGGSNIDYAKSACATADGGYIITGFSQSADGDVTQHYGSTALPDFWVVKTNKDGDLEWQKTLGGNNFDDAFSIKQTADNGYIVGGRTNSTNGDVTPAHYDNEFWLVKLDATGKLQWQQTYGGSKSDIATQVVVTNDGGYMMAGYSNSSDGDVANNYGSTDLMIIKTDAAGKLQWCKTLGGSNDEYTYNLKKTIDGNYIIAASSNSKDNDLSAAEHDNINYWLIKLNEQGNILWQHTYGGSGDDAAYDVINTKGEDFLIAGNSFSNDGDVSGNHNSMWDDIWLLKLSSPEVTLVSITDFKAVIDTVNVDLSWLATHENNINHYSIQRSYNNINFTVAGTVSSMNSDASQRYFFTDSNAINVASSDTLFYRVAAIDNADSAFYSNTDTVYIIHDTIPETKNFTLKFFKTKKNNSNVDICWKVVHDNTIKQYTVQRSTDSIAFTDIGILSSLKTDTAQLYIYTDTGIINSSPVNTLYYRTKAIDENDSAIYTNVDVVQWKQKDSLPASHPLQLTAFKAAINNNDVDISWKAIHESNVQYYMVQRSTDSITFTTIAQLKPSYADSIQAYFYTDTGIIKNSPINKLYYRTAAVDNNSLFTYTKTDVIYWHIKDTTPVTRPFAFTSFKASVQQNNVDVLWKAIHESNVKQYIIQRSNDNIHFNNIGNIIPQSFDSIHTYFFSDVNIVTASLYTTLYYRAVAVDLSDSLLYSKTDTVQLKAKNPLPEPPFSLKGFKAVRDNSNADISWKAMYEMNIKYYIIQRSTDSVIFTEICRLASGNNEETQQYFYIDKDIAVKVSSSVLYYRAVAVSQQDSLSYTKTDAVYFKKKDSLPENTSSFSIRIGPNPVHNILKVAVNNYNGKINISITDERGKLLLRKSADITDNAYIDIPFYNYAAGAYFANIYVNGSTIKKKIIKQ